MSANHSIARIRPAPAQVVTTPQCCVEIYRNPAVPSVYWAHRKRRDEARGFDSNFCVRASTFEIDGKHYCSGHAGQVALGILLSGGRATEVNGRPS